MKLNVRYLVVQPGRGGLPRYFWQPSSKLRKAGWRAERLPLNWASHQDPAALEAAAIARARELNAGLDAARDAAGAPPPTAAGRPTLGDLVRHYQASRAFTGLAPSTQRGYRQCLGKLADWAADAPVAAIDAVRVKALGEALRATPAYGNAVVRVLRLLLEFGRTTRVPGTGAPYVTVNAALRPALAGAEPTGLIWPRAAVEHFVATADAMGLHSMGTAVLLNEWLGQREGDVLRMPRTVLRGGSLVLRQSKTGAGVSLPISLVPHLAARLEAELARHQAVQIIASEETGRAYKPDNFRHVFARVRAAAAKTRPAFEVDHLLPGRDSSAADAFVVRMLDLTFMHLRHTAITRLAEAGCTPGQIAGVSGHSEVTVSALMRRYLVRTAELARVAFQRRLDAEGGTAAGKREDVG